MAPGRKLTAQENYFRELTEVSSQLNSLVRASIPESLDNIAWRLRLVEIRARFDMLLDLMPRPTGFDG